MAPNVPLTPACRAALASEEADFLEWFLKSYLKQGTQGAGTPAPPVANAQVQTCITDFLNANPSLHRKVTKMKPYDFKP